MYSFINFSRVTSFIVDEEEGYISFYIDGQAKPTTISKEDGMYEHYLVKMNEVKTHELTKGQTNNKTGEKKND